jgi:hypothetical protein
VVRGRVELPTFRFSEILSRSATLCPRQIIGPVHPHCCWPMGLYNHFSRRAAAYRRTPFIRVTSVLIVPPMRTCVALVLATPGRSATPRTPVRQHGRADHLPPRTSIRRLLATSPHRQSCRRITRTHRDKQNRMQCAIPSITLNTRVIRVAQSYSARVDDRVRIRRFCTREPSAAVLIADADVRLAAPLQVTAGDNASTTGSSHRTPRRHKCRAVTTRTSSIALRRPPRRNRLRP